MVPEAGPPPMMMLRPSDPDTLIVSVAPAGETVAEMVSPPFNATPEKPTDEPVAVAPFKALQLVAVSAVGTGAALAGAIAAPASTSPIAAPMTESLLARVRMVGTFSQSGVER